MENTPYSATLGIPVIQTDRIIAGGRKSSGGEIDIGRLIAQGIITTLIFLIIITWFTLVLNVSVRGPILSDYYLFQFGVYFTIVAILIILFIIYIITKNECC